MHFLPAIEPPAQPSEHSWALAFVDGRLLLADREAIELLPLSDAVAWRLQAETAHYLGRLDGADCWALRLPEVPSGWRSLPLRGAMMGLPAPLSALAGRAAQVLEWDRTHRFCGACGTPTAAAPGERARRCPACGLVAYPRISPAMMALVWRPGQLLLARAPHFVPGMYSALAGFVEAGESIEHCLRREVAEEVGVQVDQLHYYGSQSWPFPNSLMIAFSARWTGGEVQPQPGEIEDAQWFDLDALPSIPPRFSIAGNLIRDGVDALRAGRPPGPASA